MPALLIVVLLMSSLCFGEPYLAVREGYDCSLCHSNHTGGGMRSAFGNSYAQTQLSANLIAPETPWTGQLMGPIAVGGNARYSGKELDVKGSDNAFGFSTDRVNVYLSATPNQYISIYIDEQLAPGGSITRESWIKLNINENWYLKAGKIFLPYGWRLEDDQAFVRRVTGINFATADNGVELGHHVGNWFTQLSVSNGSGGGAENDDGKQLSVRSALVRKRWQLGISANANNGDNGDKTMLGIFAGFNTGPVSWLAEWDFINDDGDSIVEEQSVALLEANILVAKGHNLKITAETLMPDSNNNNNNNQPDQYRYSAQWEFFPWPYSQLRAGLRHYDSDDDNPLQNAEEYFVQLHAFF